MNHHWISIVLFVFWILTIKIIDLLIFGYPKWISDNFKRSLRFQTMNFWVCLIILSKINSTIWVFYWLICFSLIKIDFFNWRFSLKWRDFGLLLCCKILIRRIHILLACWLNPSQWCFSFIIILSKRSNVNISYFGL